MVASCLYPHILLEDGTGALLLERGGYLLQEGGRVSQNPGSGRVRKIERKLGTCTLAVLLVNAGYNNPAKIRAASDAELLDAGVTAAQLALIRATY